MKIFGLIKATHCFTNKKATDIRNFFTSTVTCMATANPFWVEVTLRVNRHSLREHPKKDLNPISMPAAF